MAPETINREEFDRRLDAANERLQRELQQVEEQQTQAEQLLAQYERTLDEIEADLNSSEERVSYSALLRKRLKELAEKTAMVASSV